MQRLTRDGAAHAYCKDNNNVSHMTIVLLILHLSASATFAYAYGNNQVASSTARPPSTSTSNTQPYSEPEYDNPLAPWMARPPTNPVAPSLARPPPSNTQPCLTRRPTRRPNRRPTQQQSRWPTVEPIANKPSAAILIDSFSSCRPTTPLPTPYPSKPPTTKNNRPEIIWLPAEEDYTN